MIYKLLIEKYLNDLNTGVKIPKKDISGEWTEQHIQYQDILKCYCTLSVPRQVFLFKYNSLPQLETIPAEEKTEWKKFVNEIFPGTTPQFRLDAVKIIYTIGVLSNE